MQMVQNRLRTSFYQIAPDGSRILTPTDTEQGMACPPLVQREAELMLCVGL